MWLADVVLHLIVVCIDEFSAAVVVFALYDVRLQRGLVACSGSAPVA